MRVVMRVIQWLRKYELGVLIGVLVVVSATWGFIELADEVFEHDTRAFDRWMLLALREPGHPETPIGPPWLREVARDVTALGSVVVLALVIAVVTGFLVLWPRWAAAAFVLSATLGGWLLGSLLKLAFARPRPTVVPHLAQVHSYSFPSGHSMMSAVVYLTLTALVARLVGPYRLKVYVLAVALMLTALIGASRVYLGVHYPTDVLAGWIAGLAWSSACWLAAHFLRRRGAIQEEI